jgi:hypothetical protein
MESKNPLSKCLKLSGPQFKKISNNFALHAEVFVQQILKMNSFYKEIASVPITTLDQISEIKLKFHSLREEIDKSLKEGLNHIFGELYEGFDSISLPFQFIEGKIYFGQIGGCDICTNLSDEEQTILKFENDVIVPAKEEKVNSFLEPRIKSMILVVSGNENVLITVALEKETFITYKDFFEIIFKILKDVELGERSAYEGLTFQKGEFILYL